jgi:hypothetical protein
MHRRIIHQLVTFGVVFSLRFPTTLSACASPSAVMATEKANLLLATRSHTRSSPSCRRRSANAERETPLA